MKTTIKGMTLTISLSASFKGSLDEVPNQKQEMAETHLQDADISAGVEFKMGLEEMSADITPDEISEALKAIVDVAHGELDARMRKESMRFERERMDYNCEKAKLASKDFKNE